MNKVAIYRKESFNAAHRLHNPAWSDEKNKEVFGFCNNKNYHGHNYELVVKVTGELDADTGFVMDLKVLSELIHKEILERFDHKNLNMDTVEFANLNPTVENMVVVFYNILKPKLDKSLELKITLYETERNYAEYPA